MGDERGRRELSICMGNLALEQVYLSSIVIDPFAKEKTVECLKV